MKRLNYYFLLFFASVFAILITGSCKKSSTNNNGNSSAITVANLVGTYALTDLTVSVAPFPPASILDSVPVCQRDDLYKLNNNSTYNYIDAGTKCVPAGDGLGTWTLSGMTMIIDTTHSTIVKFDGKVLQLNTPVVYNGISATTTETLTKQ